METNIMENDCTATLNAVVKSYIKTHNFLDAERSIISAMTENPHDAAPHNLMGILMEHENNHLLAMKHFRAAWSLDPTFRPARYNMDKYGSFGSSRFREDAYDDSDCPEEFKKADQYKIEYDNAGIGHVVRR